jgi:hypothetical protein
MIKSLLWKEWCQLRWKLVFSSVILLSFLCIGLQSRILQDEVIIISTMLGGVCLMPVFVAMGLFADELHEGSIFMQLGMAVEAWKVYAIKILVGSAVCLLPIVLSIFVAMVTVGGREVSTQRIGQFFYAIPFAFMFLLWTTVFGIRLDSGAKVGLLAVVVYGGWVVMVIVDDIFLTETALRDISLVVTPTGFIRCSFGIAGKWPGILGVKIMLSVQAVLSAGFFLWGMKRFCKLAGRQR